MLFCQAELLVTVNLFLINSLPNDKILARSKLKAFADNKWNLAKMIISVFDWVVTSIFSFSCNVFKWLLPQCFRNSGLCGKGLKHGNLIHQLGAVFCWYKIQDCLYMNRTVYTTLPHMPILGFVDSAANKDMVSKNMDKWRYSYLIE